MGSSSDWETMKHAVEMLERFDVPYEKHIVSAHRTPEWLVEFASGVVSTVVLLLIMGIIFVVPSWLRSRASAYLTSRMKTSWRE